MSEANLIDQKTTKTPRPWSLQTIFKPKKDLRFLTIKSEKFQKIGKVHDHIRKISNCYYIVRERNKASKGFHFHALISVKGDPPKSWFRKGVHMNMLKVGRSQDAAIIPEIPIQFSAREEAEWAQADPEKFIAYYEAKVIDRALTNVVRKARAQTNVQKILYYMAKDQVPIELSKNVYSTPIQYLDYILVVGGKHKVLPLTPHTRKTHRPGAPARPGRGVNEV